MELGVVAEDPDAELILVGCGESKVVDCDAEGEIEGVGVELGVRRAPVSES